MSEEKPNLDVLARLGHEALRVLKETESFANIATRMTLVIRFPEASEDNNDSLVITNADLLDVIGTVAAAGKGVKQIPEEQ